MRTPSIPRPLALLSLLVLTLVPSPGHAASAWPTSPLYLYPIAPNPSADQVMCGMLADGAGGAFALWTDKRSSTDDVYLQRVTATGQISPGWPATGFQVCAFSSQKLEPQMVSDNASGVIVVWVDKRSGNGDIFAQRVLGNASLAGGSWPANGLQLTTNAQTDRRPMICSDGAGGVLAAWELVFSATDTDIYGAHVTQSGSLTFSQAFDAAVNNSRSISVTSDTAGGFYIAYQDSSSAFSGQPQIYGMRLNGAGSTLVGKTKLSPTTFASNINPHLAPDGAGGLYAVWMVNDLHPFYDLEGERFGSNLAIFPPWVTFGGSNLFSSVNGLGWTDFNVIPDGLNGILFSYNLGGFSWLGHAGPTRPSSIGWPVNIGQDQRVGSLAPDGSHGAIVAYQGPDNGVYAQRVAADGTIVASWGSGAGLHTNSYLDLNIFDVPDLNHGAIVGWSDYAFPNIIPNVCAERVDRFGALGNPEPVITSIADVSGDQGGHVRLAWNGSYLDADPYYAISSYYVWRQTPLSSAQAAAKLGAQWVDDPSAAAGLPVGGRIFRHDASGVFAWEFIASQPTNGNSQYTYTAPTTRDSSAISNPRTAFMVEARWTGGATAFWDSAPDSGYSVDNLAPAAPAQFTGQYNSGTSYLHWLPNVEPDLAVYRLYRGTTANFTPGVSNNVASPPDTGYVDAAGAAYYYKLSAVDVHGNESPFVTLLPQGVSGVGVGTPAPKLALAVVSANPMSREAALRFDLTGQGSVRLTIYNAAGQRVREVVGGDFQPGQWFAKWNGIDGGGVTVPSGLYFVRLEAEGKTLTRKLVLVR